MNALPIESHTGRRLEHAIPSHLHLTTRRTFIGPIPEGWLKSHEKRWTRRFVTGNVNRTLSFRPAELPAALPDCADSDTTSVLEESRHADNLSPVQSAVAASTISLLHSDYVNRAEEVRDDIGDSSTPNFQHPKPFVDPTTTHKVRFSEPTKLQLRARAQRLIAKGNFSRAAHEDGDILKLDRMLIRIDTARQTLGTEFDEKLSLGVETKVLDKWREFIVVCRKCAQVDAHSTLQLYKTRVIATSVKDSDKVKRKPKIQIALGPSQAQVNLYSSLDKCLCLWTVGGSTSTIYYLRPQSAAASVEWFTFLRGALGWKRSPSLEIHVPDLSVSLRLDDPFRTLQTSQTIVEAARGNEEAIEKAADDEKGAAGAIVARCMNMLTQSPEWADIIKAWSQYDRIGLAWKRYDRLEWVHGALEAKMFGTVAMQKTHSLELRPKDHYPTTTCTQQGESLQEPIPIEGFLIRHTSQRGEKQRMGKTIQKRLYYATQDQYLLFTPAARAIPPVVTQQHAGANRYKFSTIQQSASSPMTWDIDPYPLEEDHIIWLQPHNPYSRSALRSYDQNAADEFDRNIDMLLACDGFINLCDIQQVHAPSHTLETVTQPGLSSENIRSAFDNDAQTENDMLRETTANWKRPECHFTIVMRNGLQVHLQAYDEDTKLQWVQKLEALAKYWRHRTKTDMEMLKVVREQNLATLKVDERGEAAMGSFAYKWEFGRSYAHPIMYNMCGITQCRAIHLSGLLFRKPRRHSTFTRCRVILSHGHLLIFQDTLRNRNGQKLAQIHHERIASISLTDSYLYSGILTENELLYQNQTFDANTPANHALPRIYLEDGWTSTDEDAMTTFVIWHAKNKSWFRSSQTVDDVRFKADANERDRQKGRKTKLTRVSQLGATGRSVVFKARSRAERDQWVTAIQVEIEHLTVNEGDKHDDVRLSE